MTSEPTTDPAPLPCPAPADQDSSVLEEIRGPLYGYYVAAYTIERPEGHFAYAKICREQPASVWETPDARAILSAGPAAAADKALEAVFKAVYERLKVKRWNLPTLPVRLEPQETPDADS